MTLETSRRPSGASRADRRGARTPAPSQSRSRSGSGKSKTLEERVCWLLAQGVAPDDIALENHAATIALYFMYCNFARVHQTLRVTLAMKAGIADHVWSVEEIVALLG